MNKVQSENLALIYAQAWYALQGQAISVSVDHAGFFEINWNDSNKILLPEWRGKLRLDAFLESLDSITRDLQRKKIRSLTERG